MYVYIYTYIVLCYMIMKYVACSTCSSTSTLKPGPVCLPRPAILTLSLLRLSLLRLLDSNFPEDPSRT